MGRREAVLRALAFVGCVAGFVVHLGAAARAGGPDLSGAWCGSKRGLERQLILHHQLAAARRGPLPVARGQTRSEDRGEIALIEADDSILLPANRFDLSGRSLHFAPRRGGGLRVTLGRAEGDPGAEGDQAIASRGRWVPLPFAFPMGGDSFTALFVAPDGHVRLGPASGAVRSRGALPAAPLIAPLWTALDPAHTRAVFVSDSPGRVRITWRRPSTVGAGRAATFSVSLFPSGEVIFDYGEVSVDWALVGIRTAQGAAARPVDFSADELLGGRGEALFEAFRQGETYDDVAVARAFYRDHPDDFDFLAVFWAFDVDTGDAPAYEINVRNEVNGIGLPIFDDSWFYGSGGRLASYLNFGTLAGYPQDPDETFLGTMSTVDLVAHEVGHRWLSYVRYDRGAGPEETLLGRDGAHWSYCFDSDASHMEGNDWRDEGDGTFTSVGATLRYSVLDQALMGLVAASAVPPFFYVDACPTAEDRSWGPDPGATVAGSAVTLGLDAIEAVEGPRLPAAGQGPASFRMAFILVVRDLESVSTEALRHLDRIRRRWNDFFPAATGGRGGMVTTLDGGPEDTDPFPPDDAPSGGGGCFGGASRGIGLDPALLILVSAAWLALQRLDCGGRREPLHWSRRQAGHVKGREP